MIYAVIDTNVLVSALISRHPDTATVQVVSAISKSRFRPLYNKEILEDPDAVFDIIKNDLDPLKKAIDFFMEQLFPKM